MFFDFVVMVDKHHSSATRSFVDVLIQVLDRLGGRADFHVQVAVVLQQAVGIVWNYGLICLKMWRARCYARVSPAILRIPPYIEECLFSVWSGVVARARVCVTVHAWALWVCGTARSVSHMPENSSI